jgi:hypothetical protein
MRQPTCKASQNYDEHFACACFHAFCAQASMKNHQVYLCVQVLTKTMTNNIGFDFVGHDDMVINRVQTHSYTNQNTRPNIWA